MIHVKIVLSRDLVMCGGVLRPLVWCRNVLGSLSEANTIHCAQKYITTTLYSLYTQRQQLHNDQVVRNLFSTGHPLK